MKILNLSRSAMVAAALTLTVGGFASAAFAQDAGVTFDRLKNAASEPQNWLLPYGDYTTRSHSALKEITKDNIGDLHVQFMTAIGGSQPASVGGVAPAQRATPLVKDGFMYVQNAWDQVNKIDLKTGQIVWQADLSGQGASSKFGSVALLGDGVFYVSRNDMIMYKLDDETGDIVWQVDTRGPDNVPGAERAMSTARSESTAELLCAELAADGLPVDREVAESLIASFVGPRPRSDAEAAELRRVRDDEVLARLPGAGPVDLRSPGQVKSLLRRAGIEVPDTRAWRLNCN